MNNDIAIYAHGLVYCSVCVPKGTTKKEIVRQVNLKNPTGIGSKWKISKEYFASGPSNPHQCETHKGRLHYLLNC